MNNISVIIPCYNQGEYLREAIDSYLNQKFMIGDPELIVIDDGSTDNSLEIARSYGNKIKVISQVNKGLPSARNTGIMNATKEWILPLDADDILLPTALYEIWSRINKFFPPDIIGLSFKEFGIRDTVISLMPNPTLEDFKTGNRIGYCSAVKTSVLKEVGGYSPKMLQGYEDLHLWFNLLKRGYKIVTIPEILWLYRTKEQSMITESIKHHETLMAQIHKDFPEVTQVINNPLPNAKT